MEIYTATLVIKKHLEWQNDKRNLPKVNEEKLKEATEILTDLVKKLTIPAVVGRSEQLVLFADWLQYNGKWDLPETQVKKFLKEQEQN